jgi:Xaa-Pro aminopeptidase
MLTHANLKAEIARRIEKIQAMMKAKGLGALIIVGNGGPDMMGALRYITNAHLWGGRAFAVLGQDDPSPWLEIWSSYQAVWSRNETTTDPDRVESPASVLNRTVELAQDYAAKQPGIGLVYGNKQLGVDEYKALSQGLEGFKVEDVTDDFNLIRQVKTPFELEAMIQNGSILDAAMDVFRENAAVGARYMDACAAVEAFIKAKGAFWGRTKLSLGVVPHTVPPPIDLRMKEDDIIDFEIVYESPWGYWLEMTTIFAFTELPDDVHRLLDGYLQAVTNSSALARPGSTIRQISEANDQTFRDLGFPVAGKHTPDCHSIGLDGYDGPALWAPDTELQANMVLSFHPGTVMENNRGFLISDNFLVSPGGGVRLSPHVADRYFMRLER